PLFAGCDLAASGFAGSPLVGSAFPAGLCVGPVVPEPVFAASAFAACPLSPVGLEPSGAFSAGDSAGPGPSQQSAIKILARGNPLSVPNASILRTTSIPATTLPKTTCLPSRCGAGAVQMKNCDPLVFRPRFAMLTTPA